jgi:hypothetical protein
MKVVWLSLGLFNDGVLNYKSRLRVRILGLRNYVLSAAIGV